MLAAIGIALTVMAWTWSERANKPKVKKYRRCKLLEEQLDLWQHRDVDKGWQGQDWAYRVLVGFLVAGWLGLLVDVLLQRFRWEVPITVVCILGAFGLIVALVWGREILGAAKEAVRMAAE